MVSSRREPTKTGIGLQKVKGQMECLQGSRGGSSSDSGKNNDKTPDREKQIVEVLPVTKLRFSGEQLAALNYHLAKKFTSDELDAKSDFLFNQATSIVERLTQRLLCAVGNLDPRFSSKFLITLQDSVSNEDRTSLEYLVRLDALSTPVLYPNDPPPCCEILEFDSDGISPGFARIRLRNKTSTNWAEFINAAGYLRRDKIQERYVELLALAAAGSWPGSPLDVDDSTLCAAPGKIMDAATVNHVLHTSPEQHVFYGPAMTTLRFPDPRDFRLAIVDEPAGIRLRVGFLTPALAGHDVEVRLLVAVGVDAWARTTDFPARIQMGHPDCLLYHQIAVTGMYLVAVGQQSTSWQIQLPAAEETLQHHYGPTSSVSLVLKILYDVLVEVHSRVAEDKCKFHCKLLSRRILRETLYHVLESDSTNPLTAMAIWSTSHVSRHVLRLLDRLVGALRNQQLPGYFFPGANLLTNLSNAREEDYLVEANRVYMYMAHLHSIPLEPFNSIFRSFQTQTILDSALISRWADVVTSQLPPSATRSSRFSFTSGTGSGRYKDAGSGAYTQYTTKQLDYVGKLVKSVLDVKQSIVQLPNNGTDFEFSIPEDPIEDIIYLLVTIIEQARDTFQSNPSKSSKTKYRTKTRSHFDSATAKLVAVVRKDRKRDASVDFTEDSVLVKAVLRWLYKAVDHSKHSLGPVLRPYLNRLFVSSHEISWTWYLDEVRRREAQVEINALGMFCRLVNAGEVTPAVGLIESVNKGWCWASSMLTLIERSSLRVIFIPARGKVQRHILSLPSYERNEACAESRSEENFARNATLPPARSVKMGTATLRHGDTVPRPPRFSNHSSGHQDLKCNNPMTETFRGTHRLGKHRCAADLVQVLAALNKISILHELSHILPQDDRRFFLTTVQRLCREHKRQAALRRRCTLPPLGSAPRSSSFLPRSRKSATSQIKQTYKPTEEGFGKEVEKKLQKEIDMKGRGNKNTLIAKQLTGLKRKPLTP